MKHLIPLIFVGIHRDITTTLQVEVPAYEIPVLMSVHGDSNVYERDLTGGTAAIEIDMEYERLTRKYGDEAVRDAYGATAKGDIRRAIINSSVGEQEDDKSAIQLEGPDSKPAAKVAGPAPGAAPVMGPPSAKWSKSDLSKHAQAQGIDVAPEWSKVEILDAIQSIPA